jgi:hypothetical protein
MGRKGNAPCLFVVVIVDFRGGNKEGGKLTPRRHTFFHYSLVLPKRRSNSCNYIVIKKEKGKKGQEE